MIPLRTRMIRDPFPGRFTASRANDRRRFNQQMALLCQRVSHDPSQELDVRQSFDRIEQLIIDIGEPFVTPFTDEDEEGYNINIVVHQKKEPKKEKKQEKQEMQEESIRRTLCIDAILPWLSRELGTENPVKRIESQLQHLDACQISRSQVLRILRRFDPVYSNMTKIRVGQVDAALKGYKEERRRWVSLEHTVGAIILPPIPDEHWVPWLQVCDEAIDSLDQAIRQFEQVKALLAPLRARFASKRSSISAVQDDLVRLLITGKRFSHVAAAQQVHGLLRGWAPEHAPASAESIRVRFLQKERQRKTASAKP